MFDDDINGLTSSAIYGKSTAQGGAGGDGYGSNGAAGGNALSSAKITGRTSISAQASTTGGAGGAAQDGSGNGGSGGVAAGALVAAIAVAPMYGASYAEGSDTGGSGGSGYGLGKTGGAGGAAQGSLGYASGYSARVVLQQTGGAGGAGHGSADGGAGGNSTLNNAVRGRSTGGYVKLIQSATGGAGGSSDGAAGGLGGSASSSFGFDDTTNPVAASLVYGKATATGGAGGDSGFSNANGAAGGGASASVSLKGTHAVDARACSYGGAGGRGLFIGQAGGAGGVATGATAYGSGYLVQVAATQKGGAGGGGYSGGGAGADSTLTNAVSGRTSGGYLSLSQTAIGGDGGYSIEDSAGAGGNADSDFSFDDTVNPAAALVLAGQSTAIGGAGGTAKYGGIGGGGGAAFARAVIVGTGETSARARADGGAGGSTQVGNGGAGGAAKGAQAVMVSATEVGYARADETGGAGGSGYGSGYSGGAGGAATGSLAFAAGYSASVKLYQTGGAGGSGTGGAAGGAGGNGVLVGTSGGTIDLKTHATNNSAQGVSGATDGGFLDLLQTVTGGDGGYSSAAGGGHGGTAFSSFNFDDTKNAVAASSIYGRNRAVGGTGGSTESSNASGGAGGAASGSVTVKGSNAVTALDYSYGGLGGSGGDGGDGGAVTGAHASAISTATIGRTYARAVETGGMGGTGFALAGAPGAHAGAGGAASGSSAFAAGYSAVAIVQQTGGAGGIGVSEAAGGAGGDSTLTNATGGQTGGGYLQLLQTATGGAGGDSHGANGGQGGLASSSLTFDDTANAIALSFIKGVSAAYGGKGGKSFADFAYGGSSGGAGGGASASIDLIGTNIVKTYADAVGGAGGAGYGAGHAGGVGGTADVSQSFASGHSVRAAAYQRGGAGGGGSGGADGGAGAASTLSNAVGGQTTGGYLTLNQVAVGGAGGYSDDGVAGAGGAARSTISLDDGLVPIAASSLYGRGIARGGAGGNGSYGGAGGGTAYASVAVTGPNSVKALAGAYGGAGGQASLDGVGGAGGEASAYAASTTSGSASTALANVTAGAGGDGSSGGTGGAATGAVSKAKIMSVSAGKQAYAKSTETAGAGGRGSGSGQSGGSGGNASGSSAFASGFSAQALVYQTGGAGGLGADGANGGPGGDSTLANAVSGNAFGGYLKLLQMASGGHGGNDDGGLAGKGGAAHSTLAFNDFGNYATPVGSKVNGRSVAVGGAGGSADLSAPGLGLVTGGAGGSASATADLYLLGTQLVSVDADSTGGAGGAGYGAGQSGGAGGVASGTHASAAGQSAIVSAEQTGGAGGWGLDGAAGGTGADSTLTNAVSGRTTGGYLALFQTATGGDGGLSYGGAGGAGGSARSHFVFDDTANPVQASSLYGKSVALGGAGGNGYTGGAGGAASTKAYLTGANTVSTVAYARGGAGGSSYTGAAAAGGGAYAVANSIATSTGSSGTANAQATAFGGAGSVDGTADAIAAAGTANGQQAQATAVARGRAGDADAITRTYGSGIVSSLVAEGDAQVGNTTTAFSLTDAGGAYGFDDGTHNAYDFATALPSASYLGSALQGRAAVDGVLGAMGATVFGASTQGYVGDADGERSYLTDTTWTVDTSALSGDLFIGLLDTQTLGSGFDSLALDIFVGESSAAPSLAFDKTFTSVAAAQAFFTDDAIDLGSFAGVPDLAVTVELAFSTGSAGAGFGVDYLLGVGPANVPPVMTVPGPQLVQQGVAKPISGISVADADADTANETITVLLSDSTGLLSATGSGVPGGGTTLTISGTLAQVNADLATLSVQENVAGSDTINIATSDGRGGSDHQQIAVDINSPPVTTVPTLQLAQQGRVTPVSGISVADADADAAGETITVVLTDSSGLVGATGTGVSGSGTQLIISGSLAQVNSDLAALTLKEDTLASDTIDVATSDGRGGSDDHQIAVSVNAQPVTTVPGDQLVQQGVNDAISGISVADADADTAGETITAVLSDQNGLLFATGSGVSPSGKTTLTISGDLADVNAALATLTLTDSTPGPDTIDVATSDGRGGSDDHQIAIDCNAPPVTTVPAFALVLPGITTPITGLGVADPDADTAGETITVVLTDTSGQLSATGVGVSASGPTQLTILGTLAQVNAGLGTLALLESALGSDTIDVATSDGRGGSDDHQIAITVDVPPVTTVPGAQLVQQGVNTPLSGISVADADADTDNKTITVVLSDTNGVLSATGIGVSPSSPTQLTISGSLAQVNAALATLTLTDNTPGPDTIDVATSDGRGGSDDHQIAVDCNAPPVIVVPGAQLVQQGATTPIAGISISDADASPAGEIITLVLSDTSGFLFATGPGVSGSGSTQLTIQGDVATINQALGGLQFNDSAYGTDTIDVAASDGRGGSDDRQIAVSINAPAVTTVPATMIAQQGRATSVPGLSVADPDADTAGEIITVVLSDTGGVLAATGPGVSGSGTQLTISGSLAQVNADLAAVTVNESTLSPDTIDVTTSDGRGAGDDHQIAVTVNAPPVLFVLAPHVVQQGVATPTFEGSPEAEPIDVSITDADVDLFVNPSTQKTFTVVLTSSNGGLFSVVENGPPFGPPIAGTSQLTFSGSLQQVNLELSTLTLLENNVGSDTIDVAASDSRGGTDDQQVTISVNGPPVTTVPGPQTVEGNVVTPIAGISVADPDADSAGETITVVLTPGGGPGGVLAATGSGVSPVLGTNELAITGTLAQVNADLATLTFKAILPFPDSPNDTIDVATSDGRGGSDDHQIAVFVNAPPVIHLQSARLVQQGQDTFVPVEVDANEGEILTVSVSDTSGQLFLFDPAVSPVPATQLTFQGDRDTVNRELSQLVLNEPAFALGSDTINVVASDSTGGHAAASTAITINAPAVMNGLAPRTVEQGFKTPLSGLSVSDPDADAAGETISVDLSDTNGLLYATGTGVSGSGTTQLFIEGSLAQVNADLLTLALKESTLGSDTIGVVTADGRGGDSLANMSVTTLARVAPVLSPVANQTDEQTSPAGAVATFAATATDALDGTDPVVFKEGNTVVHSGDTFSLGTHTITASATDSAGNTSSEQFTIKVVDTAVPVVVVVSSGSSLPIEDSAYTGQVATFTAGSPVDTASSYTATIDWGDGSTPTPATITAANGVFSVSDPLGHVYADEGPYTATVTVTRTADGKISQGSGAITVGEGDVLTAGPAVQINAVGNQAFSGTVATFADTDHLSPSGDFTATIDWGDGTTTAGTVSGGDGTFTVSGLHVYTTAGYDNVAVTLTENAPGTATAVSVGTAIVPVVAESAGFEITHDRALKFLAPGLLAPDSDADGNPLTAALAPGGGPAHGTLVLNSDGSFTYTPSAGFIGADQFTYLAVDGANAAAAPVFIFVTDQPPVTLPSTYTVLHDHQLVTNHSSGAFAGVLANDSDPDGDPLTAVLAPGGQPLGTLVLNPDGTFIYTPAAHFVGVDHFTYLASDGVEQTATTVTINVTNQAPVTNPDTYSVLHDHVLSAGIFNGFNFGVLANDRDPDGDPLTAFVANPLGAHGTLNMSADGTFTYTPSAGFVGTDTFTYLASDGVTTTPGTLTINVTDQAPIAVPATFNVVHDHQLNFGAPGFGGLLFYYDSDPDGDPLTVSAIPFGGPQHGVLQLSANGSFTYMPAQGFVGTDSFTYSVSDGALTTQGTVTINVTNQAPVTAPDSYSVLHGHTLDVGRLGDTSPGVLFNDSDPDGDALTAIGTIGGPQHGTLTLSPDGSFTYAAAPGFVGTDTFTYLASDGATTTPGKVTITVTDHAPVAVNDSYAVVPGHALTLDVLANDSDADGDPITPQVEAGPSFGSLTLQADGSFLYTPNAGFRGVDSFSYVDNDGVLNSNLATVTLDVNTAPTGATVQSIVASPPSGDFGPGTKIKFTVTMSQAVKVSGGNAYLLLNNGAEATYSSGSGTNALTFTYTVGALGSGQNTGALAVIGFDFNGATIRDANNAAHVADFAGVTAFVAGPRIDTTAPVVTEQLADDTGVADGITSDDTLSGTGDPNATVILTEGSSLLGTATADPGGNWTFMPVGLADGRHKIIASETDGAGNTGTAPLIFTLDTAPPVVDRFAVSPHSGRGEASGTLETLTYHIDEAVKVIGTPTLLLNDGGTATYDAAQSTPTSLAFEYLIAPGQLTPDLAVSGIRLSSTSAITDVAGNVMDTSQFDEESTVGVNTRPGAGQVGQTGGTFIISGTQELELFGPPGSDSSAAKVSFAPGSTGTLRLDNSADFSGTVAGLALGNSLDFAHLAFQGNTTPGYVPNGSDTGGTLSVTEGANTTNIALLGMYLAGSFVASSDGHGGTMVTDPVASPQALAPSHG